MVRLGFLSSILAAYPPPQQPPPAYPPPAAYPPPGGAPPGYPPPPGAPPMGPPGRSGKLTAAGILNILGGVISLLVMLWLVMMYLALVAEAEDLADETGVDVEVETTGFLAFGIVCLILPIVGAIFAILAGVFALKQKHWGLCLVGSIIGMIFGGTFIFCLIALILIAISKNEFIQ